MAIDNELSETSEPRTRIGCLKILGWGILILAMLVAFGLFWNHSKMASKLQKTLAELDRSEPDWRLEDIEAARDEVPEAENSARVIVAAAQQIPKPWPAAGFPDEHLRLLPANEMLSGDDFVRLASELMRAGAALTSVGKLANMPRGRHRIYYEPNPLGTRLPHLQQCRDLVTLFAYESMRRNQKGESKNALMACHAALNVARSIGDEPFFISQLVRIACIVHVCEAIEQTLGQGEPPPEDLSALQRLLENEDASSSFVVATRGERALLHQVFECVERGELSVKELERTQGGPPPPDWLTNALNSLRRMDTREDHALFLSLMTRYIKDAQRPMHEQASVEKEFEQEVGRLPKNAMMTRSLMPAISKVGDAFRREHAVLRSTIVALASERYRRENKTWPDKIDQLCPQFLAAAPLDPYDGKPLRYKPVIDGIIIYSIGQDGVDNGGNLDREYRKSPGMDLGFRLWDVPKRRQPPRPEPPPPQAKEGPAIAPPPNPK